VRLLIIALLFGCALIGPTVEAQEKVVQTFTGTGPLTTPAFKVGDKWEVRWDSSTFILMGLGQAGISLPNRPKRGTRKNRG
jgi:hypothetical protein